MTDPVQEGFSMPAEWAPHTRCWMGWPCHPEVRELEPARDAYAAVARAIARFEPVSMLANPDDVLDAQKRCGNAVEVIGMPIDDAWLRDSGPTWLVDGRGNLAGVDWRFNAWGRIYEDFENDADVARRLLELSGARRFEAPVFLEGGAIHTDGEGTLLTTESVILNPNRNPGLSHDEAESVLRAFLGIREVIWLDQALEVDSTDGHVDNLACFVRPGVVAVLCERDPEDPHFAPLRENRRRLELAKDAKGRRLEIIDIQQPRRREFRGERVCATYVNFLIANGAVIVPTFDDPADGAALQTLSRAFPEREVVGVPGFDIVKEDGCIHCITQQEPRP